MNYYNIKKNAKRVLIICIPVLLILGILIIPNHLVYTPYPTKISYTIEEQKEDGNRTYLKGSFNEDIVLDESIWMYAEHVLIQVSIKDKVYVLNDKKEDTPSVFQSAGSRWNSIRSPYIKAGDIVDITLSSYYKDASLSTTVFLDNLYVGDGSLLYHRALESLNIFGVALLFLAFAGIMFMLEGSIYLIMGMKKEGKRIVIFGFYCFTGALWSVTDIIYPYLTLFITPTWLAGILEMQGVLLFPIAIATLLYFYMRGEYTKKVMKIILGIEILSASIVIYLQWIGYADLYEQQAMLGVVALISLLSALSCLLFEMKQHRDTYLYLLILTILPVCICSMLDITNVFINFAQNVVFMRYGFEVSAFLLIFQFVSYAKAELKKENELRKLEKEVEESRISVMLSQIQPHFLYNSLVGIKQLTESDPQKASMALEHFSYYLRSNLDSLVHKNMISFKSEMEHVEDYLYLEKMRFSNKIKIQIELNFVEFSIPPLSIQALVENAIRYGITKKKGGGTLRIQSDRIGENAQVIIQDDGVGFDPSVPYVDGRSHTGIENVRSRLQLQCGGTLIVESRLQVGTKVSITIPIKERIE